MTPGDPHDPATTEPVDPHDPHARDDLPPADALWVQRLEDQLSTMKGLVALLAALAVAALGVAIWALLSDSGDDDGRAASAERVSRLDARVDMLEDDVEAAAAQGDNTQLRDDLDQKANKTEVEALARQIDALEGQVDASAAEDNAAAINELQGRVDTLAQQVEALSAGGP